MQIDDSVPAVPEVHLIRFATPRFRSMRRVRGLLTDKPLLAVTLALRLGLPIHSVRGVLDRLVECGLAMRVRGNLYVARGSNPWPGLDEREEAIGQQILICLTEPRRASDIARIVARPASVTTGHLRHLLSRKLVLRVSRGVYARADWTGHLEDDRAFRTEVPC